MDEAERCHEIAYIAYGELLAHGTVDEVIRDVAASRPTRDRRGAAAARRRAAKSGRASTSVAPFGTSLHVSGRDRAALEAAIAPYRERSKARAGPSSMPSLEDVFIGLMSRAKDNIQ